MSFNHTNYIFYKNTKKEDCLIYINNYVSNIYEFINLDTSKSSNHILDTDGWFFDEDNQDLSFEHWDDHKLDYLRKHLVEGDTEYSYDEPSQEFQDKLKKHDHIISCEFYW